MGKLASIVLNWIGGGKTPIPVRFLKSVDIPGNAPNSGNNIHILEVKGELEETTDEELFKEKLFLDGKPFEQSDISKIHVYDTFIKYNYDSYSISNIYNPDNNTIKIIGGYDSRLMDSTSIMRISISYNENTKHFLISLEEA